MGRQHYSRYPPPVGNVQKTVAIDTHDIKVLSSVNSIGHTRLKQQKMKNIQTYKQLLSVRPNTALGRKKKTVTKLFVLHTNTKKRSAPCIQNTFSKRL